jgi:hypothetical protein
MLLMEAVREKWTDERLDDMRAQMGDGFNRVDGEVRMLRSEMRNEFAAVRAEMGTRFEPTQRLIIQVGAGMFATMLIGFLGVIVTMIFAAR